MIPAARVAAAIIWIADCQQTALDGFRLVQVPSSAMHPLTSAANGAAEMIKEIVANIKTDDLEIMFRMDSGYFDEEIIETIESTGIASI